MMRRASGARPCDDESAISATAAISETCETTSDSEAAANNGAVAKQRRQRGSNFVLATAAGFRASIAADSSREGMLR
ncbi:hypothetical protein Dimus_010720, partial [Dionaea muscipula]